MCRQNDYVTGAELMNLINMTLISLETLAVRISTPIVHVIHSATCLVASLTQRAPPTASHPLINMY